MKRWLYKSALILILGVLSGCGSSGGQCQSGSGSCNINSGNTQSQNGLLDIKSKSVK